MKLEPKDRNNDTLVNSRARKGILSAFLSVCKPAAWMSTSPQHARPSEGQRRTDNSRASCRRSCQRAARRHRVARAALLATAYENAPAFAVNALRDLKRQQQVHTCSELEPLFAGTPPHRQIYWPACHRLALDFHPGVVSAHLRGHCDSLFASSSGGDGDAFEGGS